MARQRPRRTRNGLLPEAAHVVLPKRIASSGFPSTDRVCRQIGIVFDPWEADLNRCILAKTRTGAYAADTAVLSIPRQVGKTFDVGSLVFADSIINPGTTTVWTAHRFKVARESFNEMRAWAKSPLLVAHIDYDEITTGAGNECIPFRNGSRILFAARERGSVRGFTKVRRLVLDEAQILTDLGLADLVPTMNQAVNPQIVLMCTPPKPSDPGEVVTRLRDEALSGSSEGVLYVELAAPADCDPDDRAAWRKANPSYPKRTPAKAILRMRKLLSLEDFRREALGIWDGAGMAADLAGFRKHWASRADVTSVAVDPVAVGFSVAPGGSSAAVAIGGRRPDGLGHGELVDHRPGTWWLVGRLVELAEKWNPCVLVMNPAGGAARAFEKELVERGFVPAPPGKPPLPGKRRLQMTGAGEYAGACGALAADVISGQWRHRPTLEGQLDEAAASAGTRDLGEAWAWSWTNSAADIGPLEAVTLARHGFMTHGVTNGAFFGAWR